MNALKSLPLLILAACLCLSPAAFALDSNAVPDERDQQVLQALLTHLRADPNFNLARLVVALFV